MKQEQTKKPISAGAKFRSKALEDAYYKQEIGNAKKYIRYIILAAGIIFFAISLFDYSYNDEKLIFLRSIIVRGTVLVFSITCFILISLAKNVTLVCAGITIFPPVLVMGYVYILVRQAAQGLTHQSMAIMVVLFFSTIMPIRWINLATMNVFIVVFFLAHSTIYITDASTSDYVEVIIYLVLTLLFATVVQYRSDVTRREKYLWAKQLEAQSTTDKLTGVHNRLWFDYTLTDWCAGKDNVKNFSLVLMDIDNFKAINDTHGHLVGDQVLAESARVVKESVRCTDFLARWGGEEFALLLPGADVAKAAELAEHIRKSIENHSFGKVGHITFSLGVTAYEEGDQLDSLVKKADNMLYAAKNGGKNRVMIYRAELHN